MTDRKCIVGRSITCTKARSAERCLNDRSCCHQISNRTILHQLHIDRSTCRIHTECELIMSDISSLDNIRGSTDIFKSTACTSCDDSLFYIKFTIYDLILKRIIHSAIQAHKSLLLNIMQNILQICIQLIDRIYIAWMERHCDHRLDLTQVHINHSVIISNSSRVQLFILLASSMDIIKFPDLLICSPDRGQTCSLRCHNIDADTEIRTQPADTRTYEFHHFIVNIAISKCRTNDRKCNILRSYPLHRLSVKIYTDHTRHLDIISLI